MLYKSITLRHHTMPASPGHTQVFICRRTLYVGGSHKALLYIVFERQADSVAALWTAALACGADGRSAALSAALEVVTAAPTPPLAQPYAGGRLRLKFY